MLSNPIDYNSSLWTCDFWSENFIQFEAFLQVAPFCIIEWSSKCKRWTFSASVHFANKNNAARMKGLFIDVNFDGIEKLPDLGHKESTRPVKGDVHLLRQVFLEQFWKWQKESQFYEIFYLDVCLSCRRSETRAVRSAADGRTMAEVLSNRQIMSRPTNPSPWILYIMPPFLASWDAIEPTWVTQSVSQWHCWTELTDVTLVSEDKLLRTLML